MTAPQLRAWLDTLSPGEVYRLDIMAQRTRPSSAESLLVPQTVREMVKARKKETKHA